MKVGDPIKVGIAILPDNFVWESISSDGSVNLISTPSEKESPIRKGAKIKLNLYEIEDAYDGYGLYAKGKRSKRL